MKGIDYYSPRDLEYIHGARTFEAMLNVALTVLKKMPRPVALLCGPISSGGFGSFEENVRVFENMITLLEREDKVVFTQVPLELQLQAIKKTLYFGGEGHLFTALYLPIIKSRMIGEMIFLPTWRTSAISRWQHREARRIRMPVTHLHWRIFKQSGG